MTWTRGLLTLATIDPVTRERTDLHFAALTIGAPPILAVHETIRHEGTAAGWQTRDGRFAISHVPTGMRIAGFDSIFSAMDFAERAALLPAPWHAGQRGKAPAELLTWGSKLAEIYAEITG